MYHSFRPPLPHFHPALSTIVRKAAEEISLPPRDENEWYEVKGRLRGVDFSPYK